MPNAFGLPDLPRTFHDQRQPIRIRLPILKLFLELAFKENLWFFAFHTNNISYISEWRKFNKHFYEGIQINHIHFYEGIFVTSAHFHEGIFHV